MDGALAVLRRLAFALDRELVLPCHEDFNFVQAQAGQLRLDNQRLPLFPDVEHGERRAGERTAVAPAIKPTGQVLVELLQRAPGVGKGALSGPEHAWPPSVVFELRWTSHGNARSVPKRQVAARRMTW